MNPNPSFSTGLLRLAGIAGIFAGVLILSFAIVAESNKIFFYDEIFAGASIEPWLQNVQASPGLAKFIMGLPAVGFSCMFVVGFILYQYIGGNSWQKNLSLVGYAIGVPMAVAVFIGQLSLMNEVLLLSGKSAAIDAQLYVSTHLRLYYFHVVNHIFGPFFIIVLGTGMMVWAALKADILPRWICYWFLVCSTLMFISFFGFFVPLLKHAANGAPLHMLGFSMLGVILLRRSFT